MKRRGMFLFILVGVHVIILMYGNISNWNANVQVPTRSIHKFVCVSTVYVYTQRVQRN